MAITTKLRRQGGAAVMTIPPALLKLMETEVGAQLSLSVTNGELVARPIKHSRKRYSLSELLQDAEAMKALNAEVAWAQDGDPIGHEIS